MCALLPPPPQETPSPYAHLIVEDHAKLLGLATVYLQSYGIPSGEAAILNINQREEMAERQRQAIAAAIALNGINGVNGAHGHGHGHHHHPAAGIGGWNGNAAVTAAAAVALTEASRHTRGISGGSGVAGGVGAGGSYSSYGGARPRCVTVLAVVCVAQGQANLECVGGEACQGLSVCDATPAGFCCCCLFHD